MDKRPRTGASATFTEQKQQRIIFHWFCTGNKLSSILILLSDEGPTVETL